MKRWQQNMERFSDARKVSTRVNLSSILTVMDVSQPRKWFYIVEGDIDGLA